MTLRGTTWKHPAYVLPLLLLPLELLLLLTVSAVASVTFSPIYQKTLTADQIIQNESDVPSVCKCRQLCVTDNMCKAYTVYRPSSEATDCRFSHKPITVDDLEESPFAMTFIRTDDLGLPAPTASTTALPQLSTTTTGSITTNPADPITTTAEATTTSTEKETTTSTSSISTSTTTITTTTTTTSTTSTSTTTPGPVEVFLSGSTTGNASPGNLENLCGDNAVPASLTTMAKINQLITDWGSDFSGWGQWVALRHNDGNPIWPDGTLHSDTAVTNHFETWEAADCYRFNNEWKFIRKNCATSHPKKVVCERPITP